MALFVVQDLDNHVLRDGVDLLGLLHDARVVLDGACFRVYNAPAAACPVRP
jgi:hypothetical protein